MARKSLGTPGLDRLLRKTFATCQYWCGVRQSGPQQADTVFSEGGKNDSNLFYINKRFGHFQNV